MNKKLFVLAALTGTALTSCAGIRKVDFEDFQGFVNEAEKAPELEDMIIKGTYEGEKYNFKTSELGISDIKEATLAGIVRTDTVYFYSRTELKDANYYVVAGFRISRTKNDGSKVTVEFNKYGLLTHISTKGAEKATNLSVSYKYAK